MYTREVRETKLTGMAICKVMLSDCTTAVVSTHITLPCTYTPDWQCDDGYTWHDEGSFDYDYKDSQVTYPDEYTEFTTKGEIKEGDKTIKRLIEVITEDLSEEL